MNWPDKQTPSHVLVFPKIYLDLQFCSCNLAPRRDKDQFVHGTTHRSEKRTKATLTTHCKCTVKSHVRDVTWRSPVAEHWGMCPDGGAQLDPGCQIKALEKLHALPSSETNQLWAINWTRAFLNISLGKIFLKLTFSTVTSHYFYAKREVDLTWKGNI